MSSLPSHWGGEGRVKRSKQQRISELGCVGNVAEGLEGEGGQGSLELVCKVTD